MAKRKIRTDDAAAEAAAAEEAAAARRAAELVAQREQQEAADNALHAIRETLIEDAADVDAAVSRLRQLEADAPAAKLVRAGQFLGLLDAARSNLEQARVNLQRAAGVLEAERTTGPAEAIE